MLNRVGVEMELQKSQDKFAEFIISSPEERYLNLMETRPELIDRVPQYQLASFLGVTPESLRSCFASVSVGKGLALTKSRTGSVSAHPFTMLFIRAASSGGAN